MGRFILSGHRIDEGLTPIYTRDAGGAAFSVGAWATWGSAGIGAINVPQPVIVVGQLLVCFNSGLVSSSDLDPINSGQWTEFHTLSGFPAQAYGRIATGTANDEFQRKAQDPNTMGASQMMAITIAGTAMGATASQDFFGGGANINSLYNSIDLTGSGESLCLSHTCRFTAAGTLTFTGPDGPLTEIGIVYNTDEGGAWFLWGFDLQSTPAAFPRGDWLQTPTNSKPLYGRTTRLFLT